jgi:hypothetical protein
MDLRKKLEAEHSKSLTVAIIKYVDDDKNRFKDLIEVMFGTDYTLSQRASWPLSYILLKHPVLVKPYYKKLIDKLGDKSCHPSIIRNILRSFEKLEIPEKHQAPLLKHCFVFIRNETIPVAIRAFSITTAANICKHYPELKNELLLLIEELKILPQPPAIKVRVRDAIKMLQKVMGGNAQGDTLRIRAIRNL